MNDAGRSGRRLAGLRWLRRSAAALGGTVLLAVTALLAVACSGGSPGTGPGASPSQEITQRMVAFVRCLRSHGEPSAYLSSPGSAADAPASGLHIMGFNLTGVTPGTGQFASALKACRHLLPFRPPKPLSQQQKEQLLRFAACMRAHGYPAYPDPVFRNGGVIEQPLPASIDTASPPFEAALKACNAAS